MFGTITSRRGSRIPPGARGSSSLRSPWVETPDPESLGHQSPPSPPSPPWARELIRGFTAAVDGAEIPDVGDRESGNVTDCATGPAAGVQSSASESSASQSAATPLPDSLAGKPVRSIRRRKKNGPSMRYGVPLLEFLKSPYSFNSHELLNASSRDRPAGWEDRLNKLAELVAQELPTETINDFFPVNLD